MSSTDFLQKFQKLLLAQPTYNLRSVVNTNCEYVHCLSRSKNAYMCFTGYKCEDCFYCHFASTLKDCCDTLHCSFSELCYECVDCERCYNCDFCVECADSRDLKFCYDCKGSSNCFGSVGLRRKEYYFFNEPCSKEEYFKKVAEWPYDTEESRRAIEERVELLRLKHPHIASVQLRSDHVFGNHIYNSKNCFTCFSVIDVEDGAYLYHIPGKSKDLYDSECIVGELLYECVMGYDLYNCSFCLQCGNTRDSEFCIRVFNSQNMFGCVSVNHGKYQILNQPYEPLEWAKKMRQLREELRTAGELRNWLPDVWEVD